MVVQSFIVDSLARVLEVIILKTIKSELMRKLMINLKELTINNLGRIVLKFVCHLGVSIMIIVIEPGLAI